MVARSQPLNATGDHPIKPVPGASVFSMTRKRTEKLSQILRQSKVRNPHDPEDSTKRTKRTVIPNNAEEMLR